MAEIFRKSQASPLPFRAPLRPHGEFVDRSGSGGGDVTSAVEAGGMVRVVRVARKAEIVEEVEDFCFTANRTACFNPSSSGRLFAERTVT